MSHAVDVRGDGVAVDVDVGVAVGSGSGMLFAFLICIAQIQFRLIPLEGGTFIIDYYPVKMIFSDFLLVAATVFIVSLLAAWIPSRKAAMQCFSLKS